MQSSMSTSSKGNLWVFPEPMSIPQEILELVDGDSVLGHLLMGRGYDTVEKAREFLEPESYTPTSPMELPDMAKAVRRITEAIEKKQHIKDNTNILGGGSWRFLQKCSHNLKSKLLFVHRFSNE